MIFFSLPTSHASNRPQPARQGKSTENFLMHTLILSLSASKQWSIHTSIVHPMVLIWKRFVVVQLSHVS